MSLPPIEITDNVVQFPEGYKEPPSGDRMLTAVPFGKCSHWNTTFEIDDKAGTAKCLGCNGEVSLLFVLLELMKKESQWMRTRAAYQDEMKRLEERSSTKCQNCQKMTRISHR